MHARLTLLIALLLCLGAQAAHTQSANQSSPLGTNLSHLRDYETEYPFVDAFKTSRDWIPGERWGCWQCAAPLDVDEHGWVRSLDASRPNGGQVARTILFTDLDGQYPAGTYTVLYDGEGTLEYWGAATLDIAASTPGRHIVQVDPAAGSFFMTLVATNPANYVRNIRVLMPGFSESDLAQVFHPTFLTNLQPFSILRFMNWMSTNDSWVTEMADYTEIDDARWISAPIEIMTALGNRMNADVWVTMPHAASDAFVREFATRVRDTLSPDRRVYVEYSNEVWNQIFSQQHYVAVRGCETWPELGCDNSDTNPGNGIVCEGFPWPQWSEACWTGLRRYYPHRSVEIWGIFAEVFGGTDRLVRVMASQTGSTFLHYEYLTWENAWQQTDVLATAPYFGGVYGGVPEVANWTLDQLFADLETVELPAALQRMATDSALLQQYLPHVRHVAYEGGQHLAGIFGNEHNEQLNALFDTANRDARMGTLYRSYLEGWRASGGTAFVNYLLAGRWSRWGRWGVLEHQDQPHATSPKYQALLSFAEANPCWWECEHAPTNQAPTAQSQSATVVEDGSTALVLAGSDPEGTTLTFTIATPPAHGALSGAPPNVTYVPNPNYSGPDSFSFRVSDGALTSADALVSIDVTAVNDAPVNAVPGVQWTAPGVPIIFSRSLGNGIAITDVDAGTNDVAVNLIVNTGTLTLNGHAGLQFRVGDSLGGMTVLGAVAEINAALDGMTFGPRAGFVGVATLRITTLDMGHTGPGGRLSDADSVIVKVGGRPGR